MLKHQAAELHTRELQEKLAVAQLREAEQLSHEQAQRNGVAELYLERQLTSEASAREYMLVVKLLSRVRPKLTLGDCRGDGVSGSGFAVAAWRSAA